MVKLNKYFNIVFVNLSFEISIGNGAIERSQNKCLLDVERILFERKENCSLLMSKICFSMKRKVRWTNYLDGQTLLAPRATQVKLSTCVSVLNSYLLFYIFIFLFYSALLPKLWHVFQFDFFPLLSQHRRNASSLWWISYQTFS